MVTGSSLANVCHGKKDTITKNGQEVGISTLRSLVQIPTEVKNDDANISNSRSLVEIPFTSISHGIGTSVPMFHYQLPASLTSNSLPSTSSDNDIVFSNTRNLGSL